MKNNRTEWTQKTGVGNLRELGGYQTQDGKTVKSGLFFRGAATANLSAKQQSNLTQMGLKTLFDFRSEPEVQKDPDFVPDGCEYCNFSGIQDMGAMMSQMDESGNLDMKGMLKKADGDPETIALMEDYLLDGYRQMARNPVAFAAFFRRILDESALPVLFHCTAGKDRTGVCAALILRILGVSPAVVMRDYLLSDRYRAAEIRRTMFLINLAVRNRKLKEIVRKMMGVRAEFLQAFFDEADALYGSFDAFVAQGLQLTDSDIEMLKARSLA